MSTDSSLGIRQIEARLPIRSPFLMVDRVLESSERQIVTLKNVTVNEWFFAGHFPGDPLMPGSLILEGMAQSAGLLAQGLAQPEQRALGYLVGVEAARFRRRVVPGDQLIYRAELLRRRGELFRVGVEARVAEELVAQATLSLMLSITDGEEAHERGR
ncbi:MAG TPA: beta-hydroxyacyl-ACP dehydratase [Candidatus Fraserbacteria bacterium]|nr:beta-hydroxyacyl-ACP dehydratase [Candidatus Fraserbacteria bacterium]